MSHDLNQRTIFEKSVLVVSIFFISIFLAGTKACQEDYDLGSQSNVATETPESQDTNTAKNTKTPTATATETKEATETPEPTAAPEGTVEENSNTSTNDLLTELSLLKDDKEGEENKPTSPGTEKSASEGPNSENWLGKAFDGGEDDGIGIDSDSDGVADWFENEIGTDPNNASSTPALSAKPKLKRRLMGYDDDMDGLSNKEEAELKTDPHSADSDGDGFMDGVEAHSGYNANNSKSRPADEDKDGVGDDLESQLHMNPSSSDTDSDGLRDDIELAIGSNPLNPDTDKDGILDGKEYSLGWDPTVKE
jgi:hypothetical protein